MPDELTAAIYARVSTADQDYGMQLDEARAYARRMGWSAVEYREKVSAVKQRPELERLMEDARLRRIAWCWCGSSTGSGARCAI